MKYNQLSREQRYAIYLGLQEKKTLTVIARQIGCSVSTVSREINRNKNRFGKYVFTIACELTQIRRERSVSNRKLPDYVKKEALKLLVEKDWSPEQISGYLQVHKHICISHESIYRLIREDKTGELRKHTRHGMKYRRHIKIRKKGKGSKIPNRISIHDRPPEADGKRFGDWELDLIVGKGQKSALVTLTERSTNYILMAPIPDKKPKTVALKVWSLLLPFKNCALKTITTDNGIDFFNHEWIAQKLNTKVYFADPYCSWQKGAIENANKLIRQYFPKGTDFNQVKLQNITNVQHRINARPREKLNFLSPVEVFFKFCR